MNSTSLLIPMRNESTITLANGFFFGLLVYYVRSLLSILIVWDCLFLNIGSPILKSLLFLAEAFLNIGYYS